jgi:hypothetical protein
VAQEELADPTSV